MKNILLVLLFAFVANAFAVHAIFATEPNSNMSVANSGVNDFAVDISNSGAVYNDNVIYYVTSTNPKVLLCNSNCSSCLIEYQNGSEIANQCSALTAMAVEPGIAQLVVNGVDQFNFNVVIESSVSNTITVTP